MVIYDDGFNYLTKYILYEYVCEAAFVMNRLTKNWRPEVIVSGSDASDHSEKYLDAGADYVLAGEGEITLLEVLNPMSESEIKSLIFREQFWNLPMELSEIKKGSTAELDTFSHLHGTWSMWKNTSHDGWNNMAIFSEYQFCTRGCPFHCNWCAKPIYGNRYNVQVRLGGGKLKFLIATYGVSHFWMTDDIFGLKAGWILRFAELVKAWKELQFRFKIQSRKWIYCLKKMHCIVGRNWLWYDLGGCWSGLRQILDAMDRNQSGAILQLPDWWKTWDKTAFFFSSDIPRKTRMTFGLQFQWVEITDALTIMESLSAIHCPGRSFWKGKKKNSQIKSNWTDSLAMRLLPAMFSNTYPSSFGQSAAASMFTGTYRTRQGISRRWKIYSVLPGSRISFRQLKRSRRDSRSCHRGSAYYSIKSWK